MCVCMYMKKYVYMHTYIHTYLFYLYMHMYICMRVCVYWYFQPLLLFLAIVCHGEASGWQTLCTLNPLNPKP